MWTPIPFDELYDMIIATENRIMGDKAGFWKLIKIIPEKWPHKHYDKNAHVFWVVAICGYQIIWYNDIEGGFGVSAYQKYGEVDEYSSGQLQLDEAIVKLMAGMHLTQ